jgi:hypothetical protein
MVSRLELCGIIEHLTLYTRYRLNRCRYKRVRQNIQNLNSHLTENAVRVYTWTAALTRLRR